MRGHGPSPKPRSRPIKCGRVGFCDHILAVHTLLLLLDAAFHIGGGAWKFPSHLSQSGASRFLLIHRGKRLAKAQQGVSSLRGTVELGRHSEEGLCCVTIALLLKQADRK